MTTFNERLAAAMYDDGCISPPSTAHADHVAAALGPVGTVELNHDEQAAMDDLLRFMAKMKRMGLNANVSEMIAAVHVLQGFVIQHMLARVHPDWSSWYSE